MALDPGEREVLALAQQLGLLAPIDEAAGRAEGKRYGIAFSGLLGVPKDASRGAGSISPMRSSGFERLLFEFLPDLQVWSFHNRANESSVNFAPLEMAAAPASG